MVANEVAVAVEEALDRSPIPAAEEAVLMLVISPSLVTRLPLVEELAVPLDVAEVESVLLALAVA